MWRTLYISIWRIEKYLANKIIKTILVNSIGSIDKGPSLYQDFIPLISGANQNNPAKAKQEIKYKNKIKRESSLKMRQSKKLKNIIKKRARRKKIACF